MGRRKKTEFPRPKVHGASGHARVRVCGREVWLGPAGSPEADARYREILSAWVASGGTSIDAAIEPAAAAPGPRHQPGADAVPSVPRAASLSLTVGGLSIAYLSAVKAGRSPEQLVKLSKWWRAREIGNALYSRRAVPIDRFGPRMLREVRDELAETPKKYKFDDKPMNRARSHVNRLVREIIAMFAWGVSEELVPVAVWQALKTTPPLKVGESAARETVARQPVADADVQAVLPHLPPVLADLVRFARLVCCRPDEACRLRMADVEPACGVLRWTLTAHKTAHAIGAKAIPIGPRAEEIVRRWAAGKRPTDIVFSRADRDRVAVEGTIPTRPYRSPRNLFTSDEIRKAIHAACDAAACAHWTPYQLRHAGLTAVRHESGVEAEAAVAGWTSPKLAFHYAKLSFEEGAAAARKLG